MASNIGLTGVVQCFAPDCIILPRVAYVFVSCMLVQQFTCQFHVLYLGKANIGVMSYVLSMGLYRCLRDRHCCVIYVTWPVERCALVAIMGPSSSHFTSKNFLGWKKSDRAAPEQNLGAEYRHKNGDRVCLLERIFHISRRRMHFGRVASFVSASFSFHCTFGQSCRHVAHGMS